MSHMQYVCDLTGLNNSYYNHILHLLLRLWCDVNRGNLWFSRWMGKTSLKPSEPIDIDKLVNNWFFDSG